MSTRQVPTNGAMRGTRVTPQKTRRSRRIVQPPASGRDQVQAIRDWAKSKGIEVSDRGRIPAHIAEQYQAEAGR